MRFFFVRNVKKYILSSALIAFLGSVLFREIFPSLFLDELHVVYSVKNMLGYGASYYTNLALVILKLLLSLLYGMGGGVIGLGFFKLLSRTRGYTILTSHSLHTLAGLFTIMLLFGILRGDVLSKYHADLAFPDTKRLFTGYFTPHVQLTDTQPLLPPDRNNSQGKSQSEQSPPTLTQGADVPQQYKVQNMATAGELFSVLNTYRAENGRATLYWDSELASMAQGLANMISTYGSINGDFSMYAADRTQAKKRFSHMADTRSYGIPHNADYFIRDFYGKSPFYKTQLLDTSWTHVGIGVSETAVALVFGLQK